MTIIKAQDCEPVENVPCEKCGRTDLPLFIDYRCPDCSEVPEREHGDYRASML